MAMHERKTQREIPSEKVASDAVGTYALVDFVGDNGEVLTMAGHPSPEPIIARPNKGCPSLVTPRGQHPCTAHVTSELSVRGPCRHE